jgi:hypothetical protein
MQSNEPFPLELFPARVREAILAEFNGRHPTTLQIARVSDALVELPAHRPNHAGQNAKLGTRCSPQRTHVAIGIHDGH